jgi:putative membrane protein
VSSLSQWQLNFSQTPMPYIIAVHMKQATTMLLFVLPFTLVDILGIKMVPLMFLIALTYMGIEGIAAKVEMPFGESVCVLEATQPAESCSDPCDLNLDLYCTELLCECEAILERLPEGEDDDAEGVLWERLYQREDDEAADDCDDGGE